MVLGFGLFDGVCVFMVPVLLWFRLFHCFGGFKGLRDFRVLVILRFV